MDSSLLALAIFAAVYILMILDLADRTVLVIFGALSMIGLGILTEEQAIAAIEWNAIGLIFGMFILVAALNESGFFRWIGLKCLALAKFEFLRIFVLFCALSAFLAAFMDSITVLVFMAALSIEVCSILKVPPLPLIIAMICSANIGGSATIMGDPPNVVIGTGMGLTFMDFITHTAPISVMAFLLNLGIFYLWYCKSFHCEKVDCKRIMEEHKDLDPFSAVKDIKQMRLALIVFAFTVTLLVMHNVLDLLVAFVAVLGSALVLLLRRKRLDDIIEKIDWHTIIFLMGLFVMVGGLEATGVLEGLADGIADAAGGSTILLVLILFWSVALISAVFDNIPVVAAMLPVIRSISAHTGVSADSLAYTTALAADISGNATPIGASANVVGLAVAEKNGVEWSWKSYCKVAIPATFAVLGLVSLLVLLTLF
ncbi:MAG: SLC13 family permease [Methanomassiliicoccales archaeon]